MPKNILAILLLLFCLSCIENKTAKSVSDSNQNNQIATEAKKSDLSSQSEGVTEPEKIKERLPDGEFDKYFLSINNSKVSLCCLDAIYNPIGNLTENNISNLLPDYKITTETDENSIRTIFTKGKNSISIVKWQSEYSNDFEIFLGKGQFIDSNIQLKKGIKIGMTKRDFLNCFFHFSDSTINKVKQVSACKDERGEVYTKYKFKSDTLSMIKFGEWVE